MTDYSEIGAVNYSALKAMAVSPLYYRYCLVRQRADTAAFALGRAVHAAILQPDVFAKRFVAYSGPVRRGKGWEAFKLAHEGDEVLTSADLALAKVCRDSALSHPMAGRILRKVQPWQTEMVLVWKDAETGIQCKGRLDATPGRVLELKTAKDISERGFGRSAAQFGYVGQIAFYHDALVARGDTPELPIIIAIQTAPPYDCAVYEVQPEQLTAGREFYRGLLRKLVECERSDEWPGVGDGVNPLWLPSWAYGSQQTEPEFALNLGEEG